MKIKFIIFTAAMFMLFARSVSAYGNAGDMAEKAKRFYDSCNFPMALRHFTRSMEMAEREDNYRVYVVSVGYIGNIYNDVGNYGRQVYYLQKGFAKASLQRDTAMLRNYLPNLISAYCKLGDIKQARRYYAISEKYLCNEPVWKYYMLYSGARIALAEKCNKEALAMHFKALHFAQGHGMGKQYELFQLCEIAMRYVELARYDSAAIYAKRCEIPARQLSHLDLLASAYCVLADSYVMLGDTVKAARYEKLHHELSDSLFNAQNIYSASNELMGYETRMAANEKSLRERKITIQTVVIIVMVVFVVALGVMLMVVLRYNRRLRLSQRLLVERNDELAKQGQDSKHLLEYWMGQNDKPRLAPETEHGNEPDTPDGISMPKEQEQKLLNKIIGVMGDMNYLSNPDLTLAILAKEVESNTRYVSWIINNCYGKNFKTLLNELRIREACKRLQDLENYGNKTIQAVYEEVGYKNSVSFIRAFRNVNGMTPSEYQRAIKERDSNKQ